MVAVDFLVSGLKFNYMAKGKIKFLKISLRYIGDLVDWMRVKYSCISLQLLKSQIILIADKNIFSFIPKGIKSC